MKRILVSLAALLLLPAAIVLANGAGEKGAVPAGKQATPVSFMRYMGHQATDEQWKRSMTTSNSRRA